MESSNTTTAKDMPKMKKQQSEKVKDEQAKTFFDDKDEEDTKQATADSASKLKKQSSYTYWVQNNKEQFPQHQDKSLIQPRKIEDPDLIKKLEEQTQAMEITKNGGSAWNKAGTW